MRFITVTMVRIYITEQSKLLKPIVEYLQKEANIRGVSVFRAISGYGEHVHGAKIMDISFDLPLAIEFFDEPHLIKKAIEHLRTMVKAEHIVCWSAQANDHS